MWLISKILLEKENNVHIIWTSFIVVIATQVHLFLSEEFDFQSQSKTPQDY
jgi:hypothetical protein